MSAAQTPPVRPDTRTQLRLKPARAQRDAQATLQAAVLTRLGLKYGIMDGLTFIEHVRAIGAYKFTPILVLTTEMDPAKKKQAKESGATGWLVKPFDPDQLLATIRRVLE